MTSYNEMERLEELRASLRHPTSKPFEVVATTKRDVGRMVYRAATFRQAKMKAEQLFRRHPMFTSIEIWNERRGVLLWEKNRRRSLTDFLGIHF